MLCTMIIIFRDANNHMHMLKLILINKSLALSNKIWQPKIGTRSKCPCKNVPDKMSCVKMFMDKTSMNKMLQVKIS